MKVKIVKCSTGYWYKDLIGSVFEVKLQSNTKYEVVNPTPDIIRFIEIDDAIIVSDETSRLKQNDNINHPSHYTFYNKEVINVIQDLLTPEEFQGYLKGNIIKYHLRAGLKGGVEKRNEDYEKSSWYQDKLNEVTSDK